MQICNWYNYKSRTCGIDDKCCPHADAANAIGVLAWTWCRKEYK